MPRNSFLASVYRGVLESRAKIFSVCCNIRGARKLRQKIFYACFATQSSKHPGREIGDVRAGRFLRARHGGRADFCGLAMRAGRPFFWGGPKKSPRSASPLGSLWLTTWPPHPRPVSRKGRGEQDLGESAGTDDSNSRAGALCPRPTFFGWSPKNSPFFQRPKKAKKVGGSRAARFGEWREKGWVTGLEPAPFGATVRRSNQLSYTHHVRRSA